MNDIWNERNCINDIWNERNCKSTASKQEIWIMLGIYSYIIGKEMLEMIWEVGRCLVTKDLVSMLRNLDLAHCHCMETMPFTPYHWLRNPWSSNLEFKVYYGALFSATILNLFSTPLYFGVLVLFFKPFISIVELLAHHLADKDCLTPPAKNEVGRLPHVLVIVKCAS